MNKVIRYYTGTETTYLYIYLIVPELDITDPKCTFLLKMYLPA